MIWWILSQFTKAKWPNFLTKMTKNRHFYNNHSLSSNFKPISPLGTGLKILFKYAQLTITCQVNIWAGGWGSGGKISHSPGVYSRAMSELLSDCLWKLGAQFFSYSFSVLFLEHVLDINGCLIQFRFSPSSSFSPLIPTAPPNCHLVLLRYSPFFLPVHYGLNLVEIDVWTMVLQKHFLTGMWLN